MEELSIDLNDVGLDSYIFQFRRRRRPMSKFAPVSVIVDIEAGIRTVLIDIEAERVNADEVPPERGRL